MAPPWVLPVALHSFWPQGFRDARRRFVPITPHRQYEMILHFHFFLKPELEILHMKQNVALNSLDFLFPGSFSGLQASGGRGLSLSRVSQQDLDSVIGIFWQFVLIWLPSGCIFTDPPVLCVRVQLKSDMAAAFGEALQRKLLEVEGLYSQVRSRYTFIQALVRRIRGLLRQPKSWKLPEKMNRLTKTFQQHFAGWIETYAEQQQQSKLAPTFELLCITLCVLCD